LRAAREQVEEAFQQEEVATVDNGNLSKGEVMDILIKLVNFMETQASEMARLIGVSDEGMDKGLKSTLLLITHRWMVDIARKMSVHSLCHWKNYKSKINFYHGSIAVCFGVGGFQSTMQKEVISSNPISEASGRVRHRKHSNEVPPDASKVNKAHLLIDDRNKYRSMCIRVHSSIWMIGGFVFVVYMGHLYIWAMIVGIQILMAKELFNLLRKANEDRRLPGFRLLNWHFFFTAMVFVYGRFLSRQLVNTVTTDKLLYRLISGIIKYQMFICYFLYIAGFVWFILTLKKKMYKYQFGQYAWTHMILFWVFAQSSFAVANIFEGIFW
ncbi:hypothetical protein Taro_002853, partial [Colocasia esculenta]|nr:hypothetical protein [Colocasia esculenta]